MNESLVQWTLLNNLGFLGNCLNFRIASKIGQEITTDFGRIDFVLEDFRSNQLIVELETVLDTNTTAQLKTKGICLSLCNTSAYHNM